MSTFWSNHTLGAAVAVDFGTRQRATVIEQISLTFITYHLTQPAD